MHTMRRLLVWISRLGFTPREVRVILFLTVTLLAGVVIRRLPLLPTRSAPAPEGNAYAESDSEFFARARSAFPDSADSPGPIRQHHAPPPTAVIDLNTATRDQLMRLPGIKHAYADRILAYRAEHGRFTRIEELRAVSGIGTKRLERLRPLVTVGVH